jgi:hypothetical protein
MAFNWGNAGSGAASGAAAGSMFGPWGTAIGAGAGFLGGGFMGGDEDPKKEAMEYLHQIPGAISPYFNPFIDAGRGAIPALQGQYGSLLSNPGGKLNDIGSGYHQSPGFQFALQQALQGSGHAAAAGGMAGSPQHEQQNMQLATDIGNQDYNNWMHNALGLYGAGLSGEEGLYKGGLTASTSMADQIAQMLAAKSKVSYEGAAQSNEKTGDMIGNFGAIGSFLSKKYPNGIMNTGTK